MAEHGIYIAFSWLYSLALILLAFGSIAIAAALRKKITPPSLFWL